MQSTTVRYDEQYRCVEIKLCGGVDMAAITALRSEVMALVQTHRCMRLLVDMRDAVSETSTMDIFDQQERTSEDLANLGIAWHQFWHAFVVGDEQEDVRFYENVAGNRGHVVRVFSSIEEAKQWLVLQE